MEITVLYTKRSLSDQDLANGTERLSRYSGAIMIEYHKSSMIIQGYIFNHIFSQVYDYEENIDAGGLSGGTMDTAHIDFEKHNKYTEVSVDYITE